MVQYIIGPLSARTVYVHFVCIGLLGGEIDLF